MFKPRKVLIASKVPFNFSSMLCLFLVKKLPFTKVLADHSITTYREKLKIIAHTKNII